MSVEPALINSPLDQTADIEGKVFKVDIYRLETGSTWALEVVNEAGTSFVCDEHLILIRAFWIAPNRLLKTKALTLLWGEAAWAYVKEEI